MSQNFELIAEFRTEQGKSASRRLRRTGKVPAILYGGRRDPRACHIELMTDQAGGRIRWGSAPGSELEENGVQQKLALLRENFSKTGRVDARHAVIDVSTFPDRYTIPG